MLYPVGRRELLRADRPGGERLDARHGRAVGIVDVQRYRVRSADMQPYPQLAGSSGVHGDSRPREWQFRLPRSGLAGVLGQNRGLHGRVQERGVDGESPDVVLLLGGGGKGENANSALAIWADHPGLASFARDYFQFLWNSQETVKDRLARGS